MILTKKYKSQEYPFKIDVFSWKWWNGVVSLELGLKISFLRYQYLLKTFPDAIQKDIGKIPIKITSVGAMLL